MLTFEQIKKFIMATDKWLHALASFGLCLAAFCLILPAGRILAAILAPVISAAFGVLKEWWDRRHPETHDADLLDLLADLLGLLPAILVIIHCAVCLK